MRGNRREETIITRLRFDHTGLNKTLFLIGKTENDQCPECLGTENAEHILMHCRMYREERAQLMQTVAKAGRQWNLKGILGTTGDGVQATQKAVVEYLREIEVFHRI